MTTETPFSPEAIYEQWAAPSTWPTWDPEVVEVLFEGPTTLGATGRLRPRQGPAMRFTITDLQKMRTFTNTSVLPGAKLAFEHSVEPHPQGSTLTVTVRLTGPLSFLWAKLMGSSMKQAAPLSVAGLCDHLAQYA